jgi:hypothetical protein
MKRLLLVLVLVVCIGAVSATNLNFQNPTDNNSITHRYTSATHTLNWVESATGGNNYVITKGGSTSYAFSGFTLPNSYAATYAAATFTGSTTHDGRSQPGVAFFDAAGTLTYNTGIYGDSWSDPPQRVEVKITGGTAYIYSNGILRVTKTGLTQTPSFIGFGWNGANSGGSYGTAVNSIYWDDYVYGQTENKYVFGLPESDDNKFIILEDIVNSANDGLFNTTSNTQTDANYMYGTWARGNVSLEAEYNNESVNLINYVDQTVWHTNYTGDTATRGSVTIDIKTNVIDAGAPDGIYVLTIPGSGQYSNRIVKKSTGGTIYFDRDVYSRGETANVTYEMTPDCWDQSTYTYHLLIIDGLTGERVYDATIPSGTSYRTGTFDYTFADDDNIGVYYAAIEGVVTATPTTAHWFAADYAELSSYMSFYGYVNDGETETPIPGANVTISQYANSVTYAYDSPDGSYNSYGYNLRSGLNTVFNITASGYDQYYVSLITASARQKYLNFTLEKTPTYAGIGIGGVAREGVLGVDNAVTYGYGAPIEGATVYVYNTTENETYTTTTNSAGWYLCDNGALCYLVNARPYIVQGNKSGYNPSPTYPVTVTGVF